MVIWPSPFPSPAGHTVIGAVPRAMFTMTRMSSTVTSPSSRQSPTHGTGRTVALGVGGTGVDVPVALGVGDDEGVADTVDGAVGVSVGTCDTVGLSVVVGVTAAVGVCDTVGTPV
jgi:hypothetical protein